MKIIGLTSHVTGNHDASVALLEDGKVTFAISEERISRIKHDNHFPVNAILEALSFGKLKLWEVDLFVSGAPPVNILRFIFTYLKGFRFTIFRKIVQWLIGRSAIFVNGGEDVGSRKGVNTALEYGIEKKKLIFVPHYLAHAETAYHFSGMNKCLVVSWDGYGIDENGAPLCGVIYKGEDGNLVELEKIEVYNSLALYYGAVTMALGFKLNDGEGKTMGLAVYGKSSSAVKVIRDMFPSFRGGVWVAKNNWLEINGVSRPDYFRFTPTYRRLRYLIEEYGAEQIAYAAQKVLEEEAGRFIKHLTIKYKIKKIAVAGGIFLNVKFNMKLLKDKIVNELFVYPNPGDGGIAVGAALVGYKKLGNVLKPVKMESALLGRSFSKKEIVLALNKFKKELQYKDLGNNLYKTVAKHIAQGEVVGWFTGRDEWGPRALGSRSVLADPRDINTKNRINNKLKQRDWFMPFAPVVLEEFKNEVLVHGYGTGFMTLTDDVDIQMAKKIPAAIHIDMTARAQVIKREVNPGYYQIVKEFYNLTKVPALLNTSFNKHGLPIVHTPKEAIDHLIWGCVDELVIEDFLITRNEKRR